MFVVGWFDENKKVVDLHSAITPESYPSMITPVESVLYVLEVPSGFILLPDSFTSSSSLFSILKYLLLKYEKFF
jgi:hypothetical protein